jgi:hypothetical protein
LPVAVALLLVLFAILPSISRAASGFSPEEAVQRAWQRAQEVGAYHFTTEMLQTTFPAPTLANVGRSSRRETLHLEGNVDLPARAIRMSLWKDGGNVVTFRDGVEVRIEDGQAYGRMIDGAWQEIDDFSDGFAPGGDLLGYLAGAKNVVELGTETRSFEFGTDPQSPISTIQFTRYGFEVDGPAFARYLRDQLESYLRERGELPLGLTLDSSSLYRGVTGEGEIWIDEHSLPLRLTVHLVYPERQNGERVEADIQTDFANFPLQATRNQVFAKNLVSSLGLPRTSREWQQAGRQPALAVGILGLLAVLIIYRRSKKVYAAFVLAVVSSILVTPLLQSQQAAAFSERWAVRRAEQERRQEEQETARELREELLAPNWDPHRDPLASERASEPANLQSPIPNPYAHLCC